MPLKKVASNSFLNSRTLSVLLIIFLFYVGIGIYFRAEVSRQEDEKVIEGSLSDFAVRVTFALPELSFS
jgi:hypothetical protein